VCVAPESSCTSPEKGGPAASASLPHSRLHLQGAQAYARRPTRPQGCAEGKGKTLEVGGACEWKGEALEMGGGHMGDGR